MFPIMFAFFSTFLVFLKLFCGLQISWWLALAPVYVPLGGILIGFIVLTGFGAFIGKKYGL